MQRPQIGRRRLDLEIAPRCRMAGQAQRAGEREIQTAGLDLAVDMKIATERTLRRKRQPSRQFVDPNHMIEAEQRHQRGAVIGIDTAVDLHGGGAWIGRPSRRLAVERDAHGRQAAAEMKVRAAARRSRAFYVEHRMNFGRRQPIGYMAQRGCRLGCELGGNAAQAVEPGRVKIERELPARPRRQASICPLSASLAPARSPTASRSICNFPASS